MNEDQPTIRRPLPAEAALKIGVRLRAACEAALGRAAHWDGTRAAWKLRCAAAKLRFASARRRGMRPVAQTVLVAMLSWGVLLGGGVTASDTVEQGRPAPHEAFTVEAAPARNEAMQAVETTGSAASSASSKPASGSAQAPTASKASSASKAFRQSASSQTAEQAAAPAVKDVPALAGDYEGDPFEDPQCVWYVWGRVKAVTGVALEFDTDSGRSARYWLSRVVPTEAVRIVRDPEAVRSNSVAVFSHGGGGDGHVVYVESVSHYSDGTPKSVVFSEDNWGRAKRPVQKTASWQEFRWRSSGSLIEYIYVS